MRFENSKSFKSQIMLGTNLRCLDNLNGIWGFDTSDSLQTTSLAESSAEAQRKTQASLSSLDQRLSVLKKKYQGQAETSHSRDGRSQTRHTRNDESGLNPQKDSRPTREGCEQDGPLRHPSNEPNDRPERLSPQNSQRDLDEETLVDAMTRSQ